MDVIVAGQARLLPECRGVLERAGFQVGDSLSDHDRCPVILGDLPQAFSQAVQLIEAGRHVLIADPSALSAPQLVRLYAARAPRQAVFIWNERRHHPAYRLVSGLVRAGEAAWRPRYLRHVTLSTERPAAVTLKWRTWESMALLIELSARQPATVSATASSNPSRGALHFLALSLNMDGVDGFIQVGLGETFERRELVLASDESKACVDERDSCVPLRLVDDTGQRPGGSRSVSCPPPSDTELARLQCLAFLEATTSAARAQAEADLWLRVAACWQASETSLAACGAPIEVQEPDQTRLRVIAGRGLALSSPAPLLRVVS